MILINLEYTFQLQRDICAECCHDEQRGVEPPAGLPPANHLAPPQPARQPLASAQHHYHRSQPSASRARYQHRRALLALAGTRHAGLHLCVHPAVALQHAVQPVATLAQLAVLQVSVAGPGRRRFAGQRLRGFSVQSHARLRLRVAGRSVLQHRRLIAVLLTRSNTHTPHRQCKVSYSTVLFTYMRRCKRNQKIIGKWYMVLNLEKFATKMM